MDGLTKIYKHRRVVDGVSLNITQGEVVGLLGPNGAGKTTTFYMITGLVKPDEGKIFLDGQEISLLPMYKRARMGIGYLPQEHSIFRKLTVEENIMSILETLDLSSAQRKERLQELLQELNIAHLARNKAYTLSGGEQRRLEVTRALVTNPAFLLLDEPFSGVDPIAVADIQGIIAQLKQRGIGVIITDHRVRETFEITDRAYIIHNGNILVSGPPQVLVDHPKAREIFLGDKFTL
jgi:lipopolysaccharide export system ATP-binding protein